MCLNLIIKTNICIWNYGVSVWTVSISKLRKTQTICWYWIYFRISKIIFPIFIIIWSENQTIIIFCPIKRIMIIAFFCYLFWNSSISIYIKQMRKSFFHISRSIRFMFNPIRNPSFFCPFCILRFRWRLN